MDKDKITIGVTLGDPGGIGPEVVLKALQTGRFPDAITIVIYGSKHILSFYQRHLALPAINYNSATQIGRLSPSSFNLMDCPVDAFEIIPGKDSKKSAETAHIFLRRGIEDLQAGSIDGLVTGPIDKSTIYSDTFPYRGHTEYLARVFNVDERLMIMVDGNLRLGVVTEHVPIREVADTLTSQLVMSKIDCFENSLKVDFQIVNPRIAVLGLNPHAGDDGLIGTEEEVILTPVVQHLQGRGKKIFGPFSADSFFTLERYKQYDGVLAMYHDQGLVPFKLLAFENGVNYTAGLPVVRTSPDHGVAYDIAGQNKANENALSAAIRLAFSIVKNRNKENKG